ncbi:protein canopy homolog 3 [Sipha flava]|uniref:Protein canopy 4 n=1 Tax=Sipha flava TaxID=143950 RepID=A0A2S2Q855_9HEMI|nr:protein canopy homolog 3 [Sipha flava]
MIQFVQSLIFILLIAKSMCDQSDEGVKYASKCEACKILATELESRLQETGKTSEYLELGYSIDQPKIKKEYRKSELRLVESLDGLCERILQYNIHKERTDSTRFAKGMSQTFETLHGLVNKGVKVELGIPYELWDKPSVEITNMKTQCEDMLENFESDIEQWYYSDQTKSLKDFLCRDRALKSSDVSCLSEILVKGDTGKIKQEL